MSATPSPALRRRRIRAVLFLAWLILNIGLIYWGLFSLPFFVGPACGKLLFYPALGYGLAIATAWLLWQRRQDLGRITLFHRVLWLGLIPLAFAWFGYVTFSRFLPSALNAIAGHPYTRAYTVDTVTHDSGSERCNHITLRELDEHASFLPVCVSQATIDTIQPGAKVWLIGKESWFGLSVSSYSYRP